MVARTSLDSAAMARRHPSMFLLALLALLLLTGSPAQASLTVGASDTGIGFGNSREFQGLRLNLVDDHVRSVDGVNLTLWRPGRNPLARHRGVSLGLVGPEADELQGIVVAGVGTHVGNGLTGLSVAGYVSSKESRGLSIALFNDARALHGVQIGLLNRAGNNPRWARWVPVLNVNL